MRFIIIICYVFLTTIANAQHFKYKAKFPNIDSSFFYKVEIPPVIAGKSQSGLADIRILNSKGKENPYIVKTSRGNFTEKDFKELKIVSKSKGADNQTHIIIDNENKQNLQNLLLFIKNADAQRTVTLSGGEDTANWYIVKEDLVLENLSENNSYGSYVESISFPPVDYRFFKITIQGKNVLPVNITHVGITFEKTSDGRYIQLPSPFVKTIDSSDKRSYIYLSFNDTYLIDKLEMRFAGSKFYKRNIAFYRDNNTSTAPIEFIVASNTPASFPLEIKAKNILLVIENEDNPPLQLAKVKAWQLNKHLVTYLAKGEAYTILFGDSTALAPTYDLRFFADSIPPTLPVISPGNVAINAASVANKKNDQDNPQIILWLVILAVMGLLLFACHKLVKELEKKKRENYT